MNVNEIKRAKPKHELLDVIQKRWSPYRFETKEIDPKLVEQCLEAASWAASSYNEQPWIFFVARRDDKPRFEKAMSCLMEANRGWAINAGVLMLTAYRTDFARNGSHNRVALHDLGQAAAHLALQAAALGLQAHQMAGVDLDAVRRNYAVPSEYEPATAIALGYADTSQAPSSDELASRDQAPRTRKPLAEFVFKDAIGK